MNKENPFRLTKIGVFYDGNYFLHVSNYYNYVHERQSRISISGLHDFIRRQVALEEGFEERLCHIVDAHYFRGRLNARDASAQGNVLYYDRVFDDILMSEGVTTHYLPVKATPGSRQEKGIDVWFALEAYELAFYKRYDVLVLITSDGDYVPLVRKLNTLGTRVMVLSWDFEYTDNNGINRTTRTSQELLEEVSYPIAMHEIIENRVKRNDPIITNLFAPKVEKATEKVYSKPDVTNSDFLQSTILSIKNGYGFIKYPNNNLFFHYQSVKETDFSTLEPGDNVQFKLAQNDEGKDIAVEVTLIK